tara:strand:+ start:232 stop:480 length:249 start_codon:yes stop_codon:yes gene_type:complete
MVHNDLGENAKIYDLVEYKLRQKIKGLPSDDVETLMVEKIIQLYREEVIFVSWDDEDLWVRMRDGSNVPKDLLIPDGILTEE